MKQFFIMLGRYLLLCLIFVIGINLSCSSLWLFREKWTEIVSKIHGTQILGLMFFYTALGAIGVYLTYIFLIKVKFFSRFSRREIKRSAFLIAGFWIYLMFIQPVGLLGIGYAIQCHLYGNCKIN